jgi:hypothetical protein
MSIVLAPGIAVAQQQVRDYNVAQMRLQAAGVEPLVPVATNRNEDGHAKTASQTTTPIRQYRDFITKRKNRWKSLYEVGCKETLVKAVQQRGGGQRAIGLVKSSLWAFEVCRAAQDALRY